MTQITYTYKQSLACSIAFCNGTCCEIKLIIKKIYTHTHTHTSYPIHILNRKYWDMVLWKSARHLIDFPSCQTILLPVTEQIYCTRQHTKNLLLLSYPPLLSKENKNQVTFRKNPLLSISLLFCNIVLWFNIQFSHIVTL